MRANQPLLTPNCDTNEKPLLELEDPSAPMPQLFPAVLCPTAAPPAGMPKTDPPEGTPAADLSALKPQEFTVQTMSVNVLPEVINAYWQAWKSAADTNDCIMASYDATQPVESPIVPMRLKDAIRPLTRGRVCDPRGPLTKRES
jgi:hypothetical protein